MNLINNPYKVVTYFGIEVTVPDDVQWIATDEDGEVYGYPYGDGECYEEDGYFWNGRYDAYSLGSLQNIPRSFNWKKSLVYVGD